MNALTLTRIEWYKSRRRVGFWIALAFFFGLLTLGLALEYRMHVTQPERYSGQPGWPSLSGAVQGFGLLVMLVLIVLLTASERTWRTERQNVIDGLSRGQYFTGKLVLLGGCALLLWTGTLLVGTLFELLNRQLLESAAEPFIRRSDLLPLAGLLLYLVMVGTIGLFFGTAASSSGAALALAFLFLFAQGPIMSQMADQGGLWQEATAYLPLQVLSSLGSTGMYDAELVATVQERARDRGLPLRLSAARAALVALAYCAVLSAGAWWSIRTRDL